ncbi:hypothetical protein Taro_023117 [Colocasia esculenta]|uniref:Uncharacterized protein n=1 Tax=Colocasia esculenta TaxID=4460 RepID=A0A843UWG7_COLES|nr:hypothetical protein [Colocasia esculenta]
MAGMLPGVECARRRRFHQGGAMELQSGTRRSSFCLYRSGHKSHLSSSSLWSVLVPTNPAKKRFNMSTQSEGLGDAAREARERLRHNSTGSLRPGSGSSGNNNNQGMVSSAALAKLQKEVFCSKKSSIPAPTQQMGNSEIFYYLTSVN